MESILLTKPKGIKRWLAIYRLYRKAFPAAERKPFFIIMNMYRRGEMDVWCAERNSRFMGFATTVKGEELVLVDYLAVEKAHRGEGIGSATLSALRHEYPDKGIFLEIESVYEKVPDQAERLRRKAFYQHCGMKPMQVMIQLFGVKMELMGFDCRIDYDTYYQFYMTHLGSWAAGHISREIHPEAEPSDSAQDSSV